MRPRSLTLWPFLRAHSRISAVRLSPPPPRREPRAARLADVLRERVAERLGVLGAQVDLVGDAVEGEGDGLVGRTAVDVVDEQDGDFLRHGEFTPAGKRGIAGARTLAPFRHIDTIEHCISPRRIPAKAFQRTAVI